MIKKIVLTLVGILASAAAYGQIAISQLPNANLPLTGAEQTIVNQNGSTRKTTVSSFGAIFPPLNATYILQSPNAGVPNSRTLVGTANEILLSDGGPLGNLVLSTPQPICTTCSPTFSGMTLTGVLNGTSALFTGTLQSSGYTGTTGTFSSTLQSNGYTGTTGSFSGALSAGSFSLTTPLPASSGGTGFGTYTIGDVLAANSSTTLVRVNDVAAGSYFRSGGAGVLPLWSTLTLPNAATTGDLLVATGTNAIGNLTAVAAGRYLRSNGTGAAPIYSTVTIPNTAVLGDIWYGSAANVVSALAGNITTTKQFLTQTGTGAVSAAPAWGVITASDLPGGFSGFANPTGLVGLTANNGVATTGTRSDATHALDQSIAPTWTGNHIWSQTLNSIIIENVLTNPNAGAAAGVELDLSNGTRQFKFLYTGTGYTGNPLSIVTGEQGDIYTSGAFPLNLGVNSLARVSMNNAAAGRQIDIVGTTNTASAVAYAGIVDQAGTRYGYWGKSSTGTTVSYESDAAVQLLGNNGTDIISLDTTHHAAITATGGLSITGHFVAFGELINNGTTCVINGGIDNYGVSSCTRASAGVVQLNFSNTTITTYSCTANAVGANLVAFISARTTTTVNITTITLGAVATDSQVSFVCF